MAFNAAIGTISIKITGDGSDLRRDVKATDKQLDKNDKAIKENEKQWKKWGNVTKVTVNQTVNNVVRNITKQNIVLAQSSGAIKANQLAVTRGVAVTNNQLTKSNNALKKNEKQWVKWGGTTQ